MATTSKKKEVKLNNLPLPELENHLEKAREELFKLRFRAITAPLKNTMQIRKLRRTIARLNTFIVMRRKEK